MGRAFIERMSLEYQITKESKKRKGKRKSEEIAKKKSSKKGISTILR